jgi:hypothetical protein
VIIILPDQRVEKGQIGKINPVLKAVQVQELTVNQEWVILPGQKVGQVQGQNLIGIIILPDQRVEKGQIGKINPALKAGQVLELTVNREWVILRGLKVGQVLVGNLKEHHKVVAQEVVEVRNKTKNLKTLCNKFSCRGFLFSHRFLKIIAV